MGVCFSANSEYHNVSSEIIDDDEIIQPPPSHYPECQPESPISPTSDDSIDVVYFADIPANSIPPPSINKWNLRLRFLKKK